MAITKVKILLTGASGFVGSSILRSLSKDKDIELHTVSKTKRINPFIISNTNHSFFDLARDNIKSLLAYENYDLLVHAAWSGLPEKSPRMNAMNAAIASKLFTEFVNSGGKAVIGIGSCLEYGNRSGNVRESDSGQNLDEFGIMKRSLFLEIAKLGIPYLWLRPFYLYGPKQHQNSLLNLTLKHLLNRDSSWISDPFGSNDFTYIGDLGRLVTILVQKELWLGELNIGTSCPAQNIEFVNSVRKVLGEEEYDYIAQNSAGMCADLTKLSDKVPHFSFTGLSDGLSLSIREIQGLS